ncbi:MAG TPA: tRNA (adenosine(37)-N6)-threonylcarbamoyltransferase complex ATPase subunit type 1 TsaE [Bacillota bacterium]|nr:tRNA (adenosine(37)-N6)-threonylcarbamoyltransferase complex ATPase subunit type 1 TsaE [Bacillota bacterium]
MFCSGVSARSQLRGSSLKPNLCFGSFLWGGEPPLYHMDLYRLNSPQELEVLDLPTLMEERAAFVIEWGDLVMSQTPEYLSIQFTYGEEDESRSLNFIPHGQRYEALCKELNGVYEGFRD